MSHSSALKCYARNLVCLLIWWPSNKVTRSLALTLVRAVLGAHVLEFTTYHALLLENPRLLTQLLTFVVLTWYEWYIAQLCWVIQAFSLTHAHFLCRILCETLLECTFFARCLCVVFLDFLCFLKSPEMWDFLKKW